MKRLKRFLGKEITLDGRLGVIVPPAQPDGHYRFAYWSNSHIAATVVSGRTLIPREPTRIHHPSNFRLHYHGRGMVGSVEHYDPASLPGKLYALALGEPPEIPDAQV